MLDGFIGPTKKSDRMRLYLNLSFDTFVDIPVSGIMSTLPIDASDENSPTRVWIRAETRLDVVQSMSRTIEASYLRGGIAATILDALFGRSQGLQTLTTWRRTPTYATAFMYVAGMVVVTVGAARDRSTEAAANTLLPVPYAWVSDPRIAYSVSLSLGV